VEKYLTIFQLGLPILTFIGSVVTMYYYNIRRIDKNEYKLENMQQSIENLNKEHEKTLHVLEQFVDIKLKLSNIETQINLEFNYIKEKLDKQ